MITLADFILDKFGGRFARRDAGQPRGLPGPDLAAARGAGRPGARGDGRGRPGAGGRRRGRLRRRRLGRPVDLVLVGLPGSGKTSVGRRIAARHGARFIDLDCDDRARRPAMTIAQLFEAEGEAGFRAPRAGRGRRPRPARPGARAPAGDRHRRRGRRRPGQSLGPLPRPAGRLAERTARGPCPAPAQLAQSPAAPPGPRSGRGDPRAGGPPGAVLRAGPPDQRPVPGRARVLERLDGFLAEPAPAGTTLLSADTRLGRIRIGAAIAAEALLATLDELGAGRAIFVSEPGAWGAVGDALATGLAVAGMPVEHVLLPAGEAAKRLAVIESAAGELARLRVERTEPLIALGGGALGDAAGFLAATWLRGVPLVHVPTTLVAQIDSSIGGKTAVDLDEGKNLVGAFHQPAAILIDVALWPGLPERQRRSALGEAVKMAALDDEPLFALLERDGPGIARADPAVVAPRCAGRAGRALRLGEGRGGPGRRARAAGRGGPAPATGREGPRRAAARIEAGRLALNLGHSLGHGFEAAAGYGDALLHGEAVAYGLRAACRIGVELGVTPADRAARIEDLLSRLDLAPAGGLGRLGLDRGSRARGAQWRQEARRRQAALGPADRRLRGDPERRPGRAGRARGRRAAQPNPSRPRASPDDSRARPPGAEPEPARHARAGDLRAGDAGRDSRGNRGPGRPSWAWPSNSSSRTTRAP